MNKKGDDNDGNKKKEENYYIKGIKDSIEKFELDMTLFISNPNNHSAIISLEYLD